MIHIPAKTRADLLALVPTDADRRQVERFIRLCEGYAALERSVIGELRYDLPVHKVEIVGGDVEALSSEAAQLAIAAWQLLDRIPPISDLQRAMEEHSARIFEMPLSKEVSGVFLFAGEIAPAFLLNSRLTPGAATFTLAHLYAHYLVDNDPYAPRVCALDHGSTEESELRADAFAEEFLMPAVLMRRYVEAGATTTVLAETFELPTSLVAARVQRLGLAGDEPAGEADVWGAARGVIMPERLVRLALEGIHSDRLTVTGFARALHVETADALTLLRLSSVTDEEAAESNEGEPESNEGESEEGVRPAKPVNGVSSTGEPGP